MADDTPITLYVSADEKQTLRREAEAEGMSLSGYCTRLIRQQRSDEAVADMAEQLNPEERFNSLVAEAKEEITESVQEIEAVAADLRDMQARSGVYSIANFELLKTEYADPRRRDALDTGKRRLRLPVEEHTHDVDGTDDSETESSSDDSDNNDLHDRLS